MQEDKLYCSTVHYYVDYALSHHSQLRLEILLCEGQAIICGECAVGDGSRPAMWCHYDVISALVLKMARVFFIGCACIGMYVYEEQDRRF